MTEGLRDRLSKVEGFHAPDLWEDIRSRDPRRLVEETRRGPSRLLAATVAIVVAVVGMGFWLVRLNEAPRPQSGTQTPTPIVPEEIQAGITQTVDTGRRFPEGVVAAYGGIWVATDPGTNQGGDLLRLDPRSGSIVARIAVPSLPGWEVGGGGITAGLGSIWISAYGTGDHTSTVVYRIDPETNALVETIDVGRGSAADVWVGDSGIWVLAFGDANSMMLYHLDAATHKEVAETDIPANWSDTVVGAGGWIWVLGNTDNSDGAPPGTLFQIDPATNAIIGRSEPAGGDSFYLVPSADRLWFWDRGWRALDATTGKEVVGPVDLPDECCAGSVGDGAGGVWVISGRGNGSTDHGVWHVTRDGVIDRSSSENPGEDADGIAAAFDAATESVWIVHYEDTVARLQIQELGVDITLPEGGSDPGYVFTNPEIGATNLAHGTQITFDVSWAGANPPGSWNCVTRITSADGSIEELRGSIDYGQPRATLRLLPETAAGDMKAVDLACSPSR